MKRTLLVLGMVLALAMTAMANVEPYDSDSEIASPMAGEVVYENTLHLEATYDGETEYPRTGFGVKTTCEPRAGVVVNGTASDDGSSNILNGAGYILDGPSWDGTDFSATIDVTTWDPGFYCFAFNPGPSGNDRVVQSFYIVDEYAKVGGNIDNATYLTGYHENLDLKELKGKQLSHAFEGVVGKAGSEGTVGSITVNYRQLDEYKVFEGKTLSLSAAGGIGVTDQTARAAVMTVGGSEIILLDKDASPDFERGAAIVRYEGDPSESKYEIDATPGETGADSWVPLVNGNVEVGIR